MVKFSLRDDILKSKHAVENPDHIPNLRKLCSKAGIQIGLYIIWTLSASLLQIEILWKLFLLYFKKIILSTLVHLFPADNQSHPN